MLSITYVRECLLSTNTHTHTHAPRVLSYLKASQLPYGLVVVCLRLFCTLRPGGYRKAALNSSILYFRTLNSSILHFRNGLCSCFKVTDHSSIDLRLHIIVIFFSFLPSGLAVTLTVCVDICGLGHALTDGRISPNKHGNTH